MTVKRGEEISALEELSNRLDDWIVSIAAITCLGITEDSVRIVKDIRTAQRIIAELAKVETPIERSEVKPGTGGMVHLSEIIEADTKRALEVVRNCRIIAAEGADNGK